VASTLLGRRVSSSRHVAIAVGTIGAVDVLAAVVVTLAIDEMRGRPELARALFAETAGGVQIAAAAVGLVVGFVRPRAASRGSTT